jgi:hypothetical protein
LPASSNAYFHWRLPSRRHVELEDARVRLAVALVHVLGRRIPQRPFEHRMRGLAVGRQGHRLEAAGAPHLERGIAGVVGQARVEVMVGAAIRLLADHRLDEAEHLAVVCDTQHAGTELVAQPPFVADALDRFGIEVDARQVALLGVLVGDQEGHLAVGVAQEDGGRAADAALGPVDLQPMDHQQRIGRIELVAEAVVSEREEVVASQRHDAREALHRLAFHRQAAARRARELAVADEAASAPKPAGSGRRG